MMRLGIEGDSLPPGFSGQSHLRKRSAGDFDI
jgi:hypothetical protein